MFKRDPAAKAAKRRERWLARVPDEAKAAATAVLGVLGDDRELSFIDRERFAMDALTTYGIVASGPGGQRAGVGLTPAHAVEALHARLTGELAMMERWAPPTADNRQATWFGSLSELETQGWEVRTDTEKYGVGAVAATACVAIGPEAVLSAVVAGERRYDAARTSLEALIAGELEPTDHWAPA